LKREKAIRNSLSRRTSYGWGFSYRPKGRKHNVTEKDGDFSKKKGPISALQRKGREESS